MFFGFQDTKQITKLFHSPSIDEWMDAVSDGAACNGFRHGRESSSAHGQKALTGNRWPGQPRSREARRAAARR